MLEADEVLDQEIADLDAWLALGEAYREWLPDADASAWEWWFQGRAAWAACRDLLEDAIMDELPILLKPTYRTYLRTRTWKIRAAWAKRWGGCTRCGRSTSKLDAHHKTYERLGWERPSDLEALCRRCHGAVHQLR